MELFFPTQEVFRITMVAILFNIPLNSPKSDNRAGDTKFASSMMCSVRAGAPYKAQQTDLMITDKRIAKREILI